MAKIILMLKDKVLREIQLGEQELGIGRDPDNAIQLENPAVSRYHAEIYLQGYAWYVEDKRSTNGTYVNGAFLTWKSALNHNDRITVGKHTLVFVEEPKDSGRKIPGSYDSGETLCLSPEDIAKLKR